jgi:hypothetical protein
MPMTRTGTRVGTMVRAAVVAVLLTQFALLAAAPAGAQPTYPPPTPPTPTQSVNPKVVSAGTEDGGTGTAGSTEDAGALAFTGADLSVLLTALAGLMGVGTALLVAARRRARAAG